MAGSSTDFRGREEEERQELGGVDQNEKERLIVGVVDFLMNKYSLKTYLESFTKLPDTSSPPATERLSPSTSDMKNNVEICLIQAFSDVIGEDIPGRVSCEFTEAIVTEVMDVVNSVTSKAKQQSLDSGSFSSIAPPSIQLSGASEARTLAGAILTMQSFLTGRTHEIMRKFMTQGIENIRILETEVLSGLSSGSEEMGGAVSPENSSEADITETDSDLLEQMKVDEAQKEEEEATMGITSPLISKEEEDDSGRGTISILETEASPRPSRASEEVFEVAEKFGTDITEEEEEATMGITSPLISKEEGDDSGRGTISILETEADSSPSRASEEIQEPVSSARSTEVAERFEADNRETASDLLEQMKVDEAQQEEEEKTMGTSSPLKSKEEEDDSSRGIISILETEASSSPSRASEEVFEVADKFEADNIETASDVSEQIRLDEAQEEEEGTTMGTTSPLISNEEDESGRETIRLLETWNDEALEEEEKEKLGTTSPLISKEDGYDSDMEIIRIPETEADIHPSRASEQVFEVVEKFGTDNTETASDVNEQMKVDEAQEEAEEATMGTTSPLISKEGDDSGRGTITILETETSSPSRAAEEIQEAVSSANSSQVAERFEADNSETASDFLEQMKVDEAQEKEEESKLESPSPPAPSSAFCHDACEESPTLTSRNSSTPEPVENQDIRELSEGDADQDLRERIINMSVGVMNAIVNEFPYSSSLQTITTLANAFRSSKREKRSLSPDDSDSPE
ncbi:unnamed protein product [Pleuronectes platessa]|uniref:Uncharacterized protein n=1 Tax=Pleuronectes platessa TaxID=8262 RepID=A0A9N7V0T4_PLEPL|nr:unnamed protein product [Pleuronectes platessa]